MPGIAAISTKIAGVLLRAHANEQYPTAKVGQTGNILGQLPFSLVRMKGIWLNLEVDLR